MFYYLYQITNRVNGKIYVGVHKTEDMNDGYMGSGKIIKRVIEKYGIDNFEKVILETFEDSKSMYAREKEVVNEEFLLREDTYNLRRGGHGGFDYINKNNLNGFSNVDVAVRAAIIVNKIRTKRLKEKMKDRSFKSALYEKVGATKLERTGSKNGWLNKHHSCKSKNQISISMKNKNRGSLNGNFGKCWINKEGLAKMIKRDEVDIWINAGWQLGRTIVT